MWYITWTIGVFFACGFGVMAMVWLEHARHAPDNSN